MNEDNNPACTLAQHCFCLITAFFSGDYAGVEGVGRVKNQPALSLAVALAL